MLYLFGFNTNLPLENPVFIVEENLIEASFAFLNHLFNQSSIEYLSICIEENILEGGIYLGEIFIPFTFDVILNKLELEKGKLFIYNQN